MTQVQTGSRTKTEPIAPPSFSLLILGTHRSPRTFNRRKTPRIKSTDEGEAFCQGKTKVLETGGGVKRIREQKKSPKLLNLPAALPASAVLSGFLIYSVRNVSFFHFPHSGDHDNMAQPLLSPTWTSEPRIDTSWKPNSAFIPFWQKS